MENEINYLRLRLTELEKQKQIEIEKETEKKTFPLKTLESFIEQKKIQINRNSYSKSIPLARFYDEEKLAFLEPIFNMLKDIQKRLEALEK
jgi:hypothetical protein